MSMLRVVLALLALATSATGARAQVSVPHSGSTLLFTIPGHDLYPTTGVVVGSRPAVDSIRSHRSQPTCSGAHDLARLPVRQIPVSPVERPIRAPA